MLKIQGNGTVAMTPEVKYSSSGKAWMRMRVVTKDRVRDKQGNWGDGEPTWLNVTVFGKQAEMLFESGVDKGTRIVFFGKASIREWTNKDGVAKQDLDVVADEVALDVTFTAYKKVTAGDAPVGKHEDTSDAGSPF